MAQNKTPSGSGGVSSFLGSLLGSVRSALGSIFGGAKEQPKQSVGHSLGGGLDDFLAGGVYDGFSSSNVRAARYNQPDNYLEVAYRNGGTYGYHDVTTREARSFYNAGSKGNWVWDNLRVRGTVFGYKKPYAYIAGMSQGYVPKYYANDRHREEHRRIGPAGHLPSSWLKGQGTGGGPYDADWAQASAPHPEADQHPMTGASPHPKASKYPMGDRPDLEDITNRKVPMAYPAGKMQRFAAGGTVRQQIGSGGDDEPIYAKPGEFIINHSAAEKNRGLLGWLNKGGDLAGVMRRLFAQAKAAGSILMALGVGDMATGAQAASMIADSLHADRPGAMRTADQYSRIRRREFERPDSADPGLPGIGATFLGRGSQAYEKLQTAAQHLDSAAKVFTRGGEERRKTKSGKDGIGDLGKSISGLVPGGGLMDLAGGGGAAGAGAAGGGGAAGAGAAGGGGAAGAGAAGVATGVGAAVLAIGELARGATKLKDVFLDLTAKASDPSSVLSALVSPYQGQVGAYNPAAVHRFQIALENLSAAVGRIFEPIIDGATQFANELNAFYTQVGPEFRQTVADLVPILRDIAREGVGSFIGVLRDVAGIVRAINPELREMGRTVGFVLREWGAATRDFIAIGRDLYSLAQALGQLAGFNVSLRGVIGTLQQFTATLVAASRTIRASFGADGWQAQLAAVTNPGNFFAQSVAQAYAQLQQQTQPLPGNQITFSAQRARHVGIEELGMQAREEAWSNRVNVGQAQLQVQQQILALLQQANLGVLFPQIAAAQQAAAAGQAAGNP